MDSHHRMLRLEIKLGFVAAATKMLFVFFSSSLKLFIVVAASCGLKFSENIDSIKSSVVNEGESYF